MKKALLILSVITLCSTTPPDKNLGFYNYCELNGKSIAPTYQKRNCVQFMDVALKNYLNIDNQDLTKCIYMNYDIRKIERALNNKDTAMVGGVSYGLVKYGYADYVPLKKIKKGDIVQYWSTTGFTNGHCGIFKGYDGSGNMLLIGSHCDSKGYGEMNTYSKNLRMYYFICRLKQN